MVCSTFLQRPIHEIFSSQVFRYNIPKIKKFTISDYTKKETISHTYTNLKQVTDFGIVVSSEINITFHFLFVKTIPQKDIKSVDKIFQFCLHKWSRNENQLQKSDRRFLGPRAKANATAPSQPNKPFLEPEQKHALLSL